MKALAALVIAAVLATPTTAAVAGTTPRNPAANVPASPSYDATCWGDGSPAAQQSATCRSQALAAINHAHAVEHVRAIRLPRNYWSLPIREQLFVIANLERTSRGLAPMQGLTRQINGWAQSGASHNTDPEAPGWSLSSGASIRSWGSNWAADYNSLTADYGWMYDDGWGGSRAATTNLACTSATARGCWGHRDIILAPYDGSRSIAVGAAAVAKGWDGYFNSYAELFARYSGPAPAFVYTWHDATSAGAR